MRQMITVKDVYGKNSYMWVVVVVVVVTAVKDGAKAKTELVGIKVIIAASSSSSKGTNSLKGRTERRPRRSYQQLK